MDITPWLAEDGHLLVTARTRGRLQQVTDMANQSGDHICVVSLSKPLLSGLSVGENIALPAMYHFNQPLEQVLDRLDSALAVLGLADKLSATPSNLSRHESLMVQLLRCMVQGSGIVLMHAPRLDDVRHALHALESLSHPMRLWVSCLARHALQFRNLPLKTMPDQDTTNDH